MTAGYTIEATPGQVAAVERDGFLVVAEPTCPICHGRASSCPPFTRKMCDTNGVTPTTKACPECVNGCVPATAGQPGDGYERCPTCNGEGVVPIVVEVVVPERECPVCYGSTRRSIPYDDGRGGIVWPRIVNPTPGAGWSCHNCLDGEGRPTGTVPARTLLRGTAEAVPVRSYVEESDGGSMPCLVVQDDPNITLLFTKPADEFDICGVPHHFADVPRPEVGDTAWIIRGEG